MVSLRLVEYSLAYKPYVGFIVTQVLNIYIYIYIYSHEGLFHYGCRPLGYHINLCICFLFHASAHNSIIIHNHTTTFSNTIQTASKLVPLALSVSQYKNTLDCSAKHKAS